MIGLVIYVGYWLTVGIFAWLFTEVVLIVSHLLRRQ